MDAVARGQVEAVEVLRAADRGLAGRVGEADDVVWPDHHADARAQPVGCRRTVGPETLRDVLEVDKRHRSGLSAGGHRTGVSGGFPSRTARQLRTASVAMATRVWDEALAMCGASTTFVRGMRPGWIFGSSSNTSSPAPAIQPS